MSKNKQPINISPFLEDLSQFSDAEMKEIIAYLYEGRRRQKTFREHSRQNSQHLMRATYYTSVETTRGTVFIALNGASGLLQMLSFEAKTLFFNQVQRRLHKTPIRMLSPNALLMQQVQTAIETEQPYSGLIDWSGFTSFQRLVLMQIQHLPVGEVCTAAQIAQAIGHPTAAGAVGRIVNENPFPGLIPCHRVIRPQAT